jgi:hypothetical protein
MATENIHGNVDQWSMVVLYNPKSGAIVHTHQVVSTQGGVHPDARAVENLALEHASHARKAPVQGVAFLHVNPRDIDFDQSYAVDVKAKRLKTIKPTARRAK